MSRRRVRVQGVADRCIAALDLLLGLLLGGLPFLLACGEAKSCTRSTECGACAVCVSEACVELADDKDACKTTAPIVDPPEGAVSVPWAGEGVTIDGKDDDWKGVPRHELTKYAIGPQGADDLSASFALQWSDRGLFVLIEIADDEPFMRAAPSLRQPLQPEPTALVTSDAVSLFLDRNPAVGHFYRFEEDESLLGLIPGEALADVFEHGWRGTYELTKRSAREFLLEVHLEWLWGLVPPSEATLGFDLVVNDLDAAGEQAMTQLSWENTDRRYAGEGRRFRALVLAGPASEPR